MVEKLGGPGRGCWFFVPDILRHNRSTYSASDPASLLQAQQVIPHHYPAGNDFIA